MVMQVRRTTYFVLLRRITKKYTPIFFLFLFILVLPPAILNAKDDKQIRVGIFQNPPIAFQDDEGFPQGIYIDLINEIARLEHWDVSYFIDSWPNCLEKLKTGKIDLMTSIAHTKERDKYFDFSKENVLTMWGQVYVSPNSEIQNILDLNGKTIAILKNGINGINFKKLCEKFEVKIQFIEKDSYNEIIQLITARTVDAGIINNVRGKQFEKEDRVERSPVMFSPFKLLFAVSEGEHKEILAAIDTQIKRWKHEEDSFYYRTLDLWYGDILETVFPKWAKLLLIVIVSLFLISSVFVFFLRYQVRIKTVALQESIENFRLIFEQATVGVAQFDIKTGRFLKVNQRYREIVGYSLEEMTGMSLMQLTHPDDFHAGSENMTQLTDGKINKFSMEKRYAQKNGSTVWVSLAVSTLRHRGGNADLFIAIIQDITERKLAEEKLRDSSYNLNEAVRAGHIGLWNWNLNTNKVIYSKEWKRQIGYEDAEITDDLSEWENRVHPEDLQPAIAVIEKSIQDINQHHRDEFRFRHKDGSYRWILAQGTIVLDEQGNPINMLGSHIDITQRVLAESKIKEYSKNLELMVEERTEKLKHVQSKFIRQEKLAAIGQLSGSVAHDIRNPLGVISNSVYFLNRAYKDTTEEQLRKHLRIMEMEVSRANNIITDLMDFSRENIPAFSEGDLNNLIKALFVKFIIPENITMELDLATNLPLFFFDSSQIQRSFHNLITNAIQAMPKGGKLQISSAERNDTVVIKIRDTGVGMSSDDIKDIFEPLFTTKSKGVGLGLSIVKTFLEKHNGTVEVESEISKGSEFIITLPIRRENIS